jgi:proteasome beta subunit
VTDNIGLSDAYRRASTSSFTEFVRLIAPDSLPGARLRPDQVSNISPDQLGRHGTTIVAASYADGVVMAGDRRATAGSMIAQRDAEKVFAADEYSLVAIAGTSGIGIELIGMFRLELEHYEKIEGTPLSLVGKANRLATILRQNLGLAMQGLAVVPLFGGWDAEEGRGRIFSYDPVGGRYETQDYHSIGSGSVFALGSIKKMYRPDLERGEAITAVVQALYDASEDDSATSGPDLARRIYPMVWTAHADGVDRVGQDELADTIDRVVSARRERPDGPRAEPI